MESDGKTYQLNFWGPLIEMNTILNTLQFSPKCPFSPGQLINVKVQASGLNGKSASGQVVSVAAGQATVVSGKGVTTVIDS